MFVSKEERIAFGCGDVARWFHAALASDYHEEVLDMLAARLPDAAILLVSQDTVEVSGNYLLHRGLDLDAARSFSVAISANSAWFKKQWQQPVGSVFQQRDLISLDEMKETRFYRTWLSQRGDFELGVGVVFFREGTRQKVLEIRFPQRDEIDVAPAARKLLTEVSPHLRNVAQTANLRRALSEAQRERDQILRLIPFPTAIVDSQCRVECMNAQAETLVRSCESILLCPDGSLHGIEPEADADLKREVQALSTNTASNRSWLRFEETDRQRRTFFTLVRLNPPPSSLQEATARVDPRSEQRIAVIAHQPAEVFHLSHDMLWQTFGLTTRESELAAGLLSGMSIGDIAVRKKLSKQTLRNQLVSVMRKTGTNRQVDLVATLQVLAMSSPA
jgi:DNA-binding CsgD family transcriptional regulator